MGKGWVSVLEDVVGAQGHGEICGCSGPDEHIRAWDVEVPEWAIHAALSRHIAAGRAIQKIHDALKSLPMGVHWAEIDDVIEEYWGGVI